ncbi:hypothetical protein [Streptococcus parasanguinis]|uniref:hypothetical protein n=1 Tax=Streptococcus parasanguinis TaxID=1318 RepID=UPI00189A1648|nr:hypothetical protein [Streptococcus parasanguinis]
MAKIDDSVKKKVPELRFKGFTDEWEQRKLGDEVRIVMGQSPNSENYTDDHETLLNTKVTHVSSCQKLKLILQPGKPAEVTFSIHLDFSGNNH